MKKAFWILITTVFVIAALSACKKKQEETTVPETEAPTEISTEAETEPAIPEGMMRSYLTGELVPEEIGLRRPVAVMFNNVKAAVPQSGISRCGVIYEAPVEGGIVRFLGVMEDYDDLDRIGSVRSARTYYVYLQQEWESIFLHYGQCNYANPYLEQPQVQNLNGIDRTGSETFFRVSDRKAPHNAYTSAEGIQAGIEKMGYDTVHSQDFEAPFQFLEEEEKNPFMSSASGASKVSIGYTNNKPWFEYNPSDGLYYRYQFGEAQTDTLDGSQLTCRNIIIQVCDYSHYYDTPYLYFELWGEGTGYYITDGKQIPITWKKETEWGPTHYYNEEGDEIMLNPGKTWVCIVQTERMDKIEINE